MLVTAVVKAEEVLKVVVPDVLVKFAVPLYDETRFPKLSSIWILTAPDTTAAAMDCEEVRITTLLAEAAVIVSV